MLEYISSSLNRSWCGGELVIHNGRILEDRKLEPFLFTPAFYPVQVAVLSNGDIFLLCREGKLWKGGWLTCEKGRSWELVCKEQLFQDQSICAIYNADSSLYLVTTDGRLWIKKPDHNFTLVPTPFIPVFIYSTMYSNTIVDNDFHMHVFMDEQLLFSAVDEEYMEVRGAYSLDCYGVVRNKTKVLMSNATSITVVGDKLAILKEGKVYYNNEKITLSFTPIDISSFYEKVLVVKGKADHELFTL